MPLLQNHILLSISTSINQGKKWVEFFLTVIQPKFKSLSYFFTQNMSTLHEITEFKSSRDAGRHYYFTLMIYLSCRVPNLSAYGAEAEAKAYYFCMFVFNQCDNNRTASRLDF